VKLGWSMMHKFDLWLHCLIKIMYTISIDVRLDSAS
jgi:hypothetical protein